MKNTVKYFVAFGALYLMVYLLIIHYMPNVSYPTDIEFWRHWTKRIFEHGIGSIYQNDIYVDKGYTANYPPLIYYVFWVFGKLQGSTDAIYNNIQQLRYFVLLFDFAGAISIILIARKTTFTFLAPLLLLLNLGYMYNTVFWGQVDSIHTTFVLYSLLFALWQRPVGSFVMFTLALNMKLQSIIFVPPMLLLWVPLIAKQPKQTLVSVLAVLFIQTLLVLPFIFNGTLDKMFAMMFRAVDYYPTISMGADNIWYLVFGNRNLSEIDDNLLWMGVSYKHWGMLMFFAASALALLSVALKGLKLLIQKQPFATDHLRLVSLSMALVAVSFFFFNTQMHERYSHPAMVFFFIYAFFSRRYLPLILVSTAYFFNLDRLAVAFGHLNHNGFYYQPIFTASIYACAILLGWIYLYLDSSVIAEVKWIVQKQKTPAQP